MGERRKDHDLFSDAIPETSPSVLQGDDYAGVEGNHVTAGPTDADDEGTDQDSSGDEPLAYVACQPPEPDAEAVQLELYPGTNDELVLLAYSSAKNLAAGAGDNQPWIAVPVSALEQVRDEAGAGRVVWDADLPDEWRPHSGNTGEQAGGANQ